MPTAGQKVESQEQRFKTISSWSGTGMHLRDSPKSTKTSELAGTSLIKRPSHKETSIEPRDGG